MPKLLADAFFQQTTVQPVVDEVALVVKGMATQTTSLQEWQNSAGAPLATLTATGAFSAINFSGPATTVVSGTTFGLSSIVGTSLLLARQDHSHGSPANPVTAHEAAVDPHPSYQQESGKGSLNGYAGLDGSARVPVVQLGAGAASAGFAPVFDGTVVTWTDVLTQAEMTTHTGAADPHPGYATDADLTAHAATSHGGTHPDLAAHDTLGLATDAELATHAAAGDPHAGYLLESVISGLATPAIVLGTAAAAGTGLTPIRHNATIAAFDATVPTTIAFGAAAAVGSIAFAARRDHTHGMPADPVTAHAAAGDPHTGYLLESVISALATPAIVLGTAAAAGTGTTPIRHNATIAVFDATAPSTQAFGDAAVVGTIAFAARRDHKHAMPANPVTAHEAAVDPHSGYHENGLAFMGGM